MTEKSIIHKNSTLHYTVTGQGTKNLLLFHGFGQDSRAFDAMAHEIQNEYTVYSVDLYFHGKSEWLYGEQPIDKAFWKDVMETFLLENKINSFVMAGFSLGCRFVLATTEEFPDRTEAIFLLAPDGIKTSFWFSISTYPYLFRKFFKSMIRHPARFKVIVNTLHELRLGDKGLLKFAEHQMNTEAKRKKVYYSWVVFRHLKFNLKHLITTINTKRIPVTIVIGKKDHVITVKGMKKFVNQLKSGHLKILDAGHAGLLKDPALVELFK